jgi:hypothetical protein
MLNMMPVGCAGLSLVLVLVLGSTFTSLKNSLTTLMNLGSNYLLFLP